MADCTRAALRFIFFYYSLSYVLETKVNEVPHLLFICVLLFFPHVVFMVLH